MSLIALFDLDFFIFFLLLLTFTSLLVTVNVAIDFFILITCQIKPPNRIIDTITVIISVVIMHIGCAKIECDMSFHQLLSICPNFSKSLCICYNWLRPVHSDRACCNKLLELSLKSFHFSGLSYVA